MSESTKLDESFQKAIKVLGDIQKAVMTILNTERKDKLPAADVTLLNKLLGQIKEFNLERQIHEFSTEDKINIVNSVKDVVQTIIKNGYAREE